MKTISIDDYNPNMGKLISLEDKEDFLSIKGSINIERNKLIENPRKYLEYGKTYYIYCREGLRSKRAVQILSIYGYSVVRVTI